MSIGMPNYLCDDPHTGAKKPACRGLGVASREAQKGSAMEELQEVFIPAGEWVFAETIKEFTPEGFAAALIPEQRERFLMLSLERQHASRHQGEA